MPLGFTTCLLGDSVCVAIAPCSPLGPGASGHTIVDLSGWDVWCWRTGAPYFFANYPGCLTILSTLMWIQLKSKGWNHIPPTKINGLFELDPLPTIIKQTSENSTFWYFLLPWNWEKMIGYCIIFWKRCEFTYGVYHLPQVPLHSRPRSGGQNSLRARLSRVWVAGGGMGLLQVPLFPESTGEFHS